MGFELASSTNQGGKPNYDLPIPIPVFTGASLRCMYSYPSNYLGIATILLLEAEIGSIYYYP